MWNSLVVFAVVALAAPPGYGEQAGHWTKALASRLEAIYTPTVLARRGLTRGRSGEIEKLGTILIVQKPGILGGGGHHGVIRRSTVRNGALTRTFQQADDGQYLFMAGDRVYIEKLEVDDNAIKFRLWTADPVERVVRGTTISDRYVVQVEFEFERNVLAAGELGPIQQTIGEFFKLESEVGAPRTIALGQTIEEVEAILGKPTTIIDLGAKKTYVYPDMRVIFVDGKVADVQ